MNPPRIIVAAAGLLAAAMLAGCGLADPYKTTAPHPTSTTSTSTSAVESGSLDPPSERDGTIPATAKAAQTQISAGVASATPRAAVDRYADRYINWQAGQLAADQRTLASISIGAARLQAQQAAASLSTDTTLTADHVSNTGQVISAQPGTGPAAGKWVIVTAERTVGQGDYHGLPPAVHVTFATVSHTRHGWVISQWTPQN